MTDEKSRITEIIVSAARNKTLKKIVFSKPKDKNIIKTSAVPFAKPDGAAMQFETFLRDGKAVHRNVPLPGAYSECAELALTGYRQTDVITSAGSCTVMIASNGAAHIKDNIAETGASVEIGAHDDEKAYILGDKSALPFLKLLGICGGDGCVLDRRRAKYRQINRFLELVGDIYDCLPPEGKLTVCDLCCGKSYLTFAVYWYLTQKKKRDVEIYGVDLKPDVIAFCSDGAVSLGYGGMRFLCENALEFTPPSRPDLVISLHACDTATDIVLAGAVKSDARVIMSTPCCHHELFGQIESPALSFVTDYPILKQKLCDAATDSLRALRLELENYAVAAIELVDPDETPKNVLLRAVKRDKPMTDAKKAALKEKYDAAVKLLSAVPKLNVLLGEEKS